MKRSGFTLIELMVVVSIIAFLAVVSVPNFMRFLAKSKRAEAYMNLGALHTAQKAHWAEHGKYSDVLMGQGGIGWQPDGYSGGGRGENFYYTYGFPGAEGKNYFTGKLETPASHLSGVASAGQHTFVIVAVGDIMGNGKPDIMTINERNEIKLVQDALAY